jgi:putative membrane-bound dehydrogenase-like protein
MKFRVSLSFCLLAATSAFAQQGDRSEVDMSSLPPEWVVPPAPVLTAEEALETFTLQPGFRIELVASEPLLQDPVAMDFDEDGRIWVVEMQSYMPNVDGEGEIAPVSRVVVLEDTTGDGRMDKSTTYMENLILPRAIRVVAGGVLVAEPPHLWFTKDTTGDGRADEKILVTDRYSRREANPEHGANGLLYGLDNWIHDAMSGTGSYRLIDGEWVLRPAVQRGQWGISHDDYGRHFTNNNTHHLRVDLVPNHYYPRNPHLNTSKGIFEQVDPNRLVWPNRITPGVNRRVQLRDDGRLHAFTAACAPLVYRGDRYPEEYVGNIFIAEPAAHFIRRTVIKEDENGFITGRNPYHEDEFLHSSDERFRPVNLYTAPDGTLYILDMYRGILQHRQFVTTYLRQQIIDRGLEEPLGLGRIYRVVHESAEPGPAPRLSEAASLELIAHLFHPNGWWRDTAQRLLVERKDLSVVPALRQMALHADDEIARIHCLWTLEGMDALDGELLAAAMRDGSHRIRAAGVRLAEVFLREDSSREILGEALRLVRDNDPRVRLQTALSLGELPSSSLKEEAFADLLQRHADQPFVAEASVSGLKNRELDFLARLLDSSGWQSEGDGRPQAIALLSAAVMRERNPQRINTLLTFALAPAKGTEWQKLAVLSGIESSGITELPFRPRALDLKPLAPSVAEKAAVVVAKLQWPGDAVEPKEALSPEMELLVARGGQQYELNCSACHQPTGTGLEGLATPLVNSDWVLGDSKSLVRIILHGKEGEVGMMPPMGGLADESIAAILSYIRRSWGNEAEVIAPETVAEVRKNTSRAQPWTAEELKALAGE